MTTPLKSQTRPDALVSAALDNGREDVLALAAALQERVKDLLLLARDIKQNPERRPSVDELARVLHAATHESPREREIALDLAADLRLAGVSMRETARQVRGTEKALSSALTARPIASVRAKNELIWDESVAKWVSRRG